MPDATANLSLPISALIEYIEANHRQGTFKKLQGSSPASLGADLRLHWDNAQYPNQTRDEVHPSINVIVLTVEEWGYVIEEYLEFVKDYFNEETGTWDEEEYLDPGEWCWGRFGEALGDVTL